MTASTTAGFAWPRISGPQEEIQSMYRLPSASITLHPSPRSMKIGSRPICCIARTGELTPPGRTSTARRYSSAERASLGILPLPGRVIVGEVAQPDLLVLRGRVQGRPILAVQVVGVGDRVEDRVALLLGAPVGHR